MVRKWPYYTVTYCTESYSFSSIGLRFKNLNYLIVPSSEQYNDYFLREETIIVRIYSFPSHHKFNLWVHISIKLSKLFSFYVISCVIVFFYCLLLYYYVPPVYLTTYFLKTLPRNLQELVQAVFKNWTWLNRRIKNLHPIVIFAIWEQKVKSF